MSNLVVKAGTTDVSCVIRIIDSSDGTPETGVEHNSSGIDLWYRREVDPGSTPLAKVSITEAALASLTTAHTDGGIEHIGDGYYRLDLADAAVATGAIGVMVGGTVTGMIVIGTFIQLVDYDPQDTVRLGLTALPNAAADAAGGLPISDAGGLDLDNDVSNQLTTIGLDHLISAAVVGGDVADNSIVARLVSSSATADWDSYDNQTDSLQAIQDDITTIDTVVDGIQTDLDNGTDGLGAIKAETALIVADTNELQTDWTNGGRLDLIIDELTTNIDAIETDTQDIQTQIGTAGAGLTDLGGMSTAMKAEVNTEALDVLNTDTFAEPGQETPGATITLAAKIGYIYKAWRNKSTQTSTTYSLFNDDTTTVDHKATVSESGGTITKTEVTTGP